MKNRLRMTTRLFAALFAMLLISMLIGCSNNQNASESRDQSDFSKQAASDQGSASGNEGEDEEGDGSSIDEDLLIGIMGEEGAAKLVEGAQTNRDRRWIASHPEALAFEGDTVQWKLLTLAADEDEAVSFVRNFENAYPAESATGDAGSALENDSSVPHLYQWDERWGYTVYSSTAFGLTGCGPTAFAMVYQGVTGKHDQSPYDMGLLAQEMGHIAQFEGTSTSFLPDAAAHFEMKCTSVPLSQDGVAEALENGAVLVANVGHGYFSHFGGHYLVLTEIDANGNLVLNDPYSAANSHRTWNVDFVLNETKALYAFTQ